ncbi:putative metalloprotease [Pseudorhodobacter antarcticus]|jgi:putative metalloprotease|uniref:Putative metalloprotease n=1 Tax=Pseudorhodobacter antarcticus TaxID=1077947 RepID=A0A1H8D1A0_9RHOB|nr:M48 family metallopeptidase [Pseudorhodobacter antarcticus]SEN00378.1 putative metalloprotease [Pseudorhodobacter antarcticus]
MTVLLPLILPLVIGYVMYRFSAWQTAQHLDSASTPLRDPGLTPVMDRMAQALELPKITVHIYDVEPVNGLAAPDGRVFLTRGFIDRYRQGIVTAEEIASVVAHELGHVALGHTKRRVLDMTGQRAVAMLLATVLSRVIPVIGIFIAQYLTSALGAGLSRKDEYEADAYASALLVKSGIGTHAQKSLFHKLDKLTGVGGANTPQWLRSHPKTADRIAAIEAREARWGV